MSDIAPFNGKQYFLLEIIDTDKIRINFCVIRDDVYQLMAEQSWLVFPESLAILNGYAKVADQPVVKVALAERTLYCYSSPSGFQSVIPNSSASTLTQIAQYHSGAMVEPVLLSTTEYAQLLVRSLLSLPSYSYLQAFNNQRLKSIWQKLPVKLMALSGSIVLVSYLALTSLWLSYSESSLTKQIKHQKKELDQVFGLQRELENAQQKQQKLTSITPLSSIISPAWVIALQLIENKATLLSLIYDNNAFTLRIKAKKSTDIMQTLSTNKLIVAPQMISPVVKSGNQEIVTVQFTLIDAGQVTQKGKQP